MSKRNKNAARTRAFSESFLAEFSVARTNPYEHMNKQGQPKAKYVSERKAVEAANAIWARDMRTELNAYKCSVCNQWHLG